MFSISNSRWYQRVLRVGQDLLQRGFVEILERCNHGQAANELAIATSNHIQEVMSGKMIIC